jgi:hypothetical protein
VELVLPKQPRKPATTTSSNSKVEPVSVRTGSLGSFGSSLVLSMWVTLVERRTSARVRTFAETCLMMGVWLCMIEVLTFPTFFKLKLL